MNNDRTGTPPTGEVLFYETADGRTREVSPLIWPHMERKRNDRADRDRA